MIVGSGMFSFMQYNIALFGIDMPFLCIYKNDCFIPS